MEGISKNGSINPRNFWEGRIIVEKWYHHPIIGTVLIIIISSTSYQGIKSYII